MGREILGIQRGRGAFAGAETSDVSKMDDPSQTERLETAVASWVDNVKNAIPIEIITAWAAIDSVVNIDPSGVSTRIYVVLFVGFLAATAVHMWADVETPTAEEAKRLAVPQGYLWWSQWTQILLAVFGFVVWAYYLGGPFAEPWLDVYNRTYATISLPLFVVFGPQLVPAVLRRLYDVDAETERAESDG